MLTDQIGNVLMKDDLVVVQVGTSMLTATVIEIKEPTVLAPGPKSMAMPGELRLSISMTSFFNLQNPMVTNVLKVVKPVHFNKKES